MDWLLCCLCSVSAFRLCEFLCCIQMTYVCCLNMCAKANYMDSSVSLKPIPHSLFSVANIIILYYGWQCRQRSWRRRRPCGYKQRRFFTSEITFDLKDWSTWIVFVVCFEIAWSACDIACDIASIESICVLIKIDKRRGRLIR